MSAPDPSTPRSSSSSIRDRLSKAIADAVAVVAGDQGLDLVVDPSTVHLERPARREHGDWSTNIAMVTAKRAAINPRALASAVVDVLEHPLPDHVVGIELAGPGFINFRLDAGWLHEALAAVLTLGEDGYARPDIGHGEKV